MITGAVIGVPDNLKSVPMMKLGTITVVERIITTFLQAGIDRIVLAAGEENVEMQKLVEHRGVICLGNKENEDTDLFGAAKIGFSYLMGECGRIAFTPVDIPMFTKETVVKLMESKEPLAGPAYQGKGGHPLVLDVKILPGILSFSGKGGLKEAVRGCGIKKTWIDVSDAGILMDVEKDSVPKDFLAAHTSQMLHPYIKVSIAKEHPFFGPGTEQLLELIESTGSVRSACQLMHMSYSKGWKMIRLMEEQWKHPVVKRCQGGALGGSSYLTEEGKDLLDRYKAYKSEVKMEAEELFSKYFLK